MLTQRILLIFSLPSLLAGCAGMLGGQAPAPVYQSRQPVYRAEPVSPVIPKPDINAQESVSSDIEIKPLPEPSIANPIELEPQPLPSEATQSVLTPEQEQELAALEHQQTPPLDAQPTTPATDLPPPVANEPIVEPIAPPPPPPEPKFEPLSEFAPLSPAVNALVLAANQNTSKGDLGTATTTIERAIRIEPRNATLYYKLALLRLKDAKPRLAEDLAKKCILLAGSDTRLKKHAWLLIARAREIQNNLDGMKEAKAKADAL